jgi:tight adherence protein C
MELINTAREALVTALGPLGPLIVVGALGLVLVLLTLPTMLKKPVDPLDKLKGATIKSTVAGQPQVLRRGDKNDKLQKFATFLEPQDAVAMSSARLKMLRAGYRSKNAVRAFHAAQFLLGIGFLLIGVIYAMAASASSEMSTQTLVISTIGPGAAGYYLPQYWVQRRLQKRQEEITSGFPDALDMMLVCVEAGQSMDQSILRVGTEIRLGYPALAEELDMVGQEVKAGKERTAVLRDMAERVGLPDVSSFVTVLIQSSTFGTSVADALRVYAAEMRDKRVMRAEEKANTLPTKLTLGTMLFTLPPLLIILIGPSIYGIATQLGGG